MVTIATEPTESVRNRQGLENTQSVHRLESRAAEVCGGRHVQQLGARRQSTVAWFELAEALAVGRLLAQHRRQLADPIEEVCDCERLTSGSVLMPCAGPDRALSVVC